jgi:hypothetical protein
MIKILLVFLLLSVIFFIGFRTFYALKKEQKIELSKLIVYSTMCSMLALGVLAILVLLF